MSQTCLLSLPTFLTSLWQGGLREDLGGDPPMALFLYHIVGLVFKKLGGEVDGRIEGESGWIEQTDEGHPPKKKEREKKRRRAFV